jgi:para-aminobenzoate synthetase/4-amino-4-deoxychorismate lyase
MKGTTKRGRWSEEDVELSKDLLQSAKDRAENVMIVDLLRNDLGRVSLPGSISVVNLFQLEKYETVWQMTSTIESVLRPNVDLAQIFTALFPCGSVTGAPKIRTMEIINELEKYPRGVYTGAIGLIRPGGDCIFNVAIRTIVIDEREGQMTLGVGSGITIDSIAAREYEECLLKGSFLEYNATEFDLLETLILEEGEIFLQQRHEARLLQSADYFGFKSNAEELTKSLERLAQSHSSGRWKVRLLVSQAGKIKTEIQLLKPATDQTLRVKLALEPVNSREQSLFHKTTNRAVYNLAKASQRDCDDVVLWNERGEITESTIANVVASFDGRLVTPPLSSGLLPGTFRAELLAAGKLHERVIHKEELLAVKNFYLINSVNRWQRALLVS